jgi:hypothetical protein
MKDRAHLPRVRAAAERPASMCDNVPNLLARSNLVKALDQNPRPAPHAGEAWGRRAASNSRTVSPTVHPTDGPHDTFLIRLGRRDIGLINRPPARRARYTPTRSRAISRRTVIPRACRRRRRAAPMPSAAKSIGAATARLQSSRWIGMNGV